jgi:HTH-type transcriptional regulator/antitoxin HigA
MSLRFDRIDNFWFVLRHELEHVLQEDCKDNFVIDVDMDKQDEDALPSYEKHANQASLNWCIDSK